MSRRKARELALRVLYQRDVGQTEPECALKTAFASTPRLNDDAREFARALVMGTLDNIDEIDRIIAQASESWTTDRMPHIDRNVLRVGLYELLFAGTPPAISISEAVFLCRRFSTPEATRFVNGILGRVAREGPLPGGDG